jgi:hypothetical protein
MEEVSKMIRRPTGSSQASSPCHTQPPKEVAAERMTAKQALAVLRQSIPPVFGATAQLNAARAEQAQHRGRVSVCAPRGCNGPGG